MATGVPRATLWAGGRACQHLEVLAGQRPGLPAVHISPRGAASWRLGLTRRVRGMWRLGASMLGACASAGRHPHVWWGSHSPTRRRSSGAGQAASLCKGPGTAASDGSPGALWDMTVYEDLDFRQMSKAKFPAGEPSPPPQRRVGRCPRQAPVGGCGRAAGGRVWWGRGPGAPRTPACPAERTPPAACPTRRGPGGHARAGHTRPCSRWHACGVRERVAHTNTRVLRLALPSLTCDFPRPSPLDRDTVPCVSGYTSKHMLRHVLSLPRNVWLRVANGKVEQGVKWHLRLR